VPETRQNIHLPLLKKKQGVLKKKKGALVWLSESSAIKLGKTGNAADLQLSKTLDISARNRKPGKARNNGIQVSLLQFPDRMGLTLPQPCQNYMLLYVRIGKIDRLRPPLNA
jgi:hypothetical protein